MKKRIQRTVTGIVALGALALGGSALAQAGGSASPAPQAAENSAVDTDNIQSGDQTGPETPDNAAEAAENESTSGPDTDNVQEGNQSGSDKADGADSESGSEVPGDDGLGGHADESVK